MKWVFGIVGLIAIVLAPEIAIPAAGIFAVVKVMK